MLTKLSIISLLILASCSSGKLSDEDRKRLEARDRQAKINSENFVDIFVTEFWNKPIKNFTGRVNPYNNGARHQYGGYKVFSRPYADGSIAYLRYFRDFVYKGFKKCNDLKSKRNLAVIGDGYRELRKKTYKNRIFRYKFAFTNDVQIAFNPQVNGKVDFSKKVCGNPRGTMDTGYLGDKLTLDAFKIKDMLIERGVPLVFCFEQKYIDKHFYNQTTGKINLLCTLDVGTMNGMAEASLSIYTKFDSSFGIALSGLNFSKQDLEKSFADVYAQRFDDPSEVKRIVDYYKRLQTHKNRAYDKVVARDQAVEAKYQASQRKLERERSEGRYKHLSKSLNKATKNLNTTGNYIQPSPVRTSPADIYIPKGTPKIAEIKKKAKSWCLNEGGTFRNNTCYNSKKDKCLKGGSKWSGKTCISKVDPKAPKVEKDKDYFDVGLSDKTYGEAVEKAKEKAAKVCGRIKKVPAQFRDQSVKVVGYKFKARVDYKCRDR